MTPRRASGALCQHPLRPPSTARGPSSFGVRASRACPPEPGRGRPGLLPFPLPGLQGDWRTGVSPFSPHSHPAPQRASSPHQSLPSPPAELLSGPGRRWERLASGCEAFWRSPEGLGVERPAARAPGDRQTLFCGRTEPSESFWGPSIPLSLLAPSLFPLRGLRTARVGMGRVAQLRGSGWRKPAPSRERRLRTSPARSRASGGSEPSLWQEALSGLEIYCTDLCPAKIGSSRGATFGGRGGGIC